ncbi:hypothetical protein [Paenibacillus sp. UNC499MF]|uniref:hypothetical protein n=1 Tax=Paenibacillus sp. UNC499MF TaxID=1502751 RepID=UPI0008A056EE|nr:hypothetical protein [Paenibacillus sp. UNC499MF]SEF72712.1 hypothetical protein SAMN02799616_01015 [Paenibacillus sp. UNC499MF]
MNKMIVGVVLGSLIVSGSLIMNGKAVPPALPDSGMAAGKPALPGDGGISGGVKVPSAGSGESRGEKAYAALPVTSSANNLEVTLHAVRLKAGTADFELTIRNLSDREAVTADLESVSVVTNEDLPGRSAEKVRAAKINPDFTEAVIRPGKERYGWLSTEVWSEEAPARLTLNVTIRGNNGEEQAFSIPVDCRGLTFRTL